MTENEAIETLKNNFPKTCKKVDGRRKGGFDDIECEFGKALLLSMSALEELQQYRAIGTVEKCREARERQRAKKPLSRTHCKDRNHPLSQDIGRCPSCNSIIAEDMLWCDDCGQKLDWSE